MVGIEEHQKIQKDNDPYNRRTGLRYCQYNMQNFIAHFQEDIDHRKITLLEIEYAGDVWKYCVCGKTCKNYYRLAIGGKVFEVGRKCYFEYFCKFRPCECCKTQFKSLNLTFCQECRRCDNCQKVSSTNAYKPECACREIQRRQALRERIDRNDVVVRNLDEKIQQQQDLIDVKMNKIVDFGKYAGKSYRDVYAYTSYSRWLRNQYIDQDVEPKLDFVKWLLMIHANNLLKREREAVRLQQIEIRRELNE